MAHLVVLQETDDFHASIEMDGHPPADLNEHFNAASRFATVDETTFLRIRSGADAKVWLDGEKYPLTCYDVACQLLRNASVATSQLG